MLSPGVCRSAVNNIPVCDLAYVEIEIHKCKWIGAQSQWWRVFLCVLPFASCQMHLRRIMHILNTNIRCSRQINNVHIRSIPDHFLFLHKYSVYGQKRTRKENIFNPRLAYKLTTKTTATVTTSKITQPKTIASYYPPSLRTDYCHEASTFRMPDRDVNVYFAEWLFFRVFRVF